MFILGILDTRWVVGFSCSLSFAWSANDLIVVVYAFSIKDRKVVVLSFIGITNATFADG